MVQQLLLFHNINYLRYFHIVH